MTLGSVSRADTVPDAGWYHVSGTSRHEREVDR